jgi:hypothetical protein
MTMRSRRLFVAFLFAGLWVAVAGLRPDTTFHLAPLIVAAWPALPERELAGAIRMSLLGLFLAAATTMMMFRLGWLDGPSLLPWGGAGLESILVGGAGALLGVFPAVLAGLRATRT